MMKQGRQVAMPPGSMGTVTEVQLATDNAFPFRKLELLLYPKGCTTLSALDLLWGRNGRYR